jgi:hypothetical protein
MSKVLAEQKIALEMGDYLKLLPHLHQTDGFFAAVFERKVMPKKSTPMKNRPTTLTLSQPSKPVTAAAAARSGGRTAASPPGGTDHSPSLPLRPTFRTASAMTETPLLNLITDFVDDFRQPAILWQALAIAACLALSLLLRQLREFLHKRAEAAATPASPETLQRTDSFIRILTPVLAAMLLGMRSTSAKFQSVNLLSIAIPLAPRWR